MRLYRSASYLLIVVLLPLLSCEKTIIEKAGEGKLYSIEGHAQKGPFRVGSNVTVAELNENLFPTGRVFFSTILNDEGFFELPGVVLESPYVQIKVEGLYFSEFIGGVDTGVRLTLFSLADIRDASSINVNILTHLEKERVEFLVQSGNKSFKEAKKQALDELLEVFSLESPQMENSSDLVIFDGENGSAILLTISSIIEAAPADRLEFITLFQKDMEDGTLDSESIQTTLLNTAAYRLKPNEVKSNLDLNFPGRDFPDFETFVNEFIENSAYSRYFEDPFPTLPEGTINLLKDTAVHIIDLSKTYVFAIQTPKPGYKLYLQIENNFKNGEGIVSSAFNNWTETYFEESCDPNNSECRNRNYYYLDMSNPAINVPLSFSKNGEFYYIVYLMTEDGSYAWPMNTNNRTIKW